MLVFGFHLSIKLYPVIYELRILSFTYINNCFIVIIIISSRIRFLFTQSLCVRKACFSLEPGKAEPLTSKHILLFKFLN